MTRDNSRYSNRNNQRNKMAWQWLGIQRPDVAKAIQDEIDRQYPLKLAGAKPKLVLPEKLQRMK